MFNGFSLLFILQLGYVFTQEKTLGDDAQFKL